MFNHLHRTIAISILRLKSIAEIDQNDYAYSSSHSVIYTLLEPSIAITVASIPLLRPLLGQHEYSSNGTARPRRRVKVAQNSIITFGRAQKSGGRHPKGAPFDSLNDITLDDLTMDVPSQDPSNHGSV